MTIQRPAVNRNTRKSYLTLSAVGERDHELRGTLADAAPAAEAIVRDERDPYIETETELRYAWGDR